MTDDILNLNNLLELYEFPFPREGNKKSVKLVFHPTSEYDLLTFFRQKQIQKVEAYQREQRKHIFENCEHIISFLQNGPSRALFFGIYHIDGYRTHDNPPENFSKNFPEMQWRPGSWWYDMTRLDCMSELVGRLVVDWGASSRAWHQWLRRDASKGIIEILPRRLQFEFPGFDNLILSHKELKEMIDDPASYHDWHKVLESVGGVYLIVDTKSGSQYVGGAYGVDGFLGRWRAYAKNGHGGNKELEKYEDFSKFQFSILHICSKSQKVVCNYETMFKEKLESRVHGLNQN